MLANNMLLSDVKPTPDVAKEAAVRSNNVSNRDSSSNHQRDDFNQVMQRSKSEQLKQEQIRQEQSKQQQAKSQQRQAELDKQSELQQSQKLDAQKQQAERSDMQRQNARNSQEQKEQQREDQQLAKNAQSKESPKSSETTEKVTQASRNDEVDASTKNENKETVEQSKGEETDETHDKKQLLKSAELESGQHDCEKSLDGLGEQVVNAGATAEDKVQNKTDKEVDTRWLDTVIDIVSSEKKLTQDTPEVQKGADAEQAKTANETSLKSIEQLLAQLQDKSATRQERADSNDELAKKAELAVLQVMEKKLAQGQAEPEQVAADKPVEENANSKLANELSDSKLMSLSQLIEREQAKANANSELSDFEQAQKRASAEHAKLMAEANNAKTIDAAALNMSTGEKSSSKATQFEQSQLLERELNHKRQIQRQSLVAQDILPNENKTKVIDLGASPLSSSNLGMSASGIDGKNSALKGAKGSDESQFGKELMQEMRSATNESDAKASNSAEQKLMESLPSSFLEATTLKANPSDVKVEKVDVAGVMVDKTLQLPKLENIANAKTDVIIRENILFNKQELANHMQQQIGIMLAKNMKSLDMRMDPPELGAMQVRLTVNNDQASVSFIVSNQQTKDALDASMPKLREMLDQQGVELTESNVQQDNGQSQKEMSDGESSGQHGSGANGEEIEEEMVDADRNRATINSPWNVSYYA